MISFRDHVHVMISFCSTIHPRLFFKSLSLLYFFIIFRFPRHVNMFATFIIPQQYVVFLSLSEHATVKVQNGISIGSIRYKLMCFISHNLSSWSRERKGERNRPVEAFVTRNWNWNFNLLMCAKAKKLRWIEIVCWNYVILLSKHSWKVKFFV